MLRVTTLLAGGLVGCVAVLVAGVPAEADTQVTVRGTGFEHVRQAQLSMVGCDALYERTTETLAPFISRGPGAAPPLGTRSLGYDLGGGNAVGSLHYVDSMVATSVAGLSVYSPAGSTGVAYAGYQDPGDAGTYDLWIGRAPLSTAPGSWSTVDATGLTYTWTKYDMRTQTAVETPEAMEPAPPSSVPEFAAAHGGDGAGFYTIGFGCDGGSFNLDAWRIGRPGKVTTYDLEGLTTTTTIAGSATRVEKGESVTLSGAVRLGRGDRLRSGTLLLESKPVGGASFEPVEVVAADTDPTVVVKPTRSTIYRWRFVDRPLAEGSVSPRFTVTIISTEEVPELPELPDPSQVPTDSPSSSPSQPPAGPPSQGDEQTPSQSADPTPSAPAAPSPTVDETPTESPTTETPTTESPAAESSPAEPTP